MQTIDILFCFSAVLILTLSAGVVTVRNPVRATFLLITSFLPTGAVYIFLNAPLVGVLQILVYAGAILILFTFVVMMINPGPGSPAELEDQDRGWKNSALFPGFPFLVAGGFAVWKILELIPSEAKQQSREFRADFGSISSIGKMIFHDSANNMLTVSFELLSFLILGGIVVAVNLSRTKK